MCKGSEKRINCAVWRGWQVEQAVFWDAVTLDAMTQWRRVHIPIFIAFAVLALGSHRQRLPVLGVEMSWIVKFVLAANLIALTVIVFAYPNLMVGPGKLIPGHKAVGNRTASRVTLPMSGASSALCVACHKPEDIGKLTTNGHSVVKPLTSVPFHQKLTTQDCIACHSDHASVKRYRWQVRFNHDLLEATARDACQTCHKLPTDALHQQVSGTCTQCHSMTKWTPATFNHDKYFQLDRDHNDRCVTCHPRNDYRAYTCYGCHEHSPEKIQRKHIKEGIRQIRQLCGVPPQRR